ncbi:ABC transporter substrate-binding protein [Candidatus Pseudothioglobus singularis]|jgi:glucose/mannose transport system substrate-binding protein|nr:ABC transporter substrate-binding protein [Candidatus Pseudothioglobus singularis]MDC0596591.1 ABC transporter substrate-binding protein [Candidatus Pseudothioglobus singularis]MDC0648676.1 ABC transporter substrate-binding protein [Candidatus Pseudothioglobus singularis]MDC1046128.1 ABC transporter substrate-binding protein [Candidatus Pseudothioglobus singularis]MDC1064842.1 ABC transporter substrate-binding protein [Candidatus Pseudothioglobus singularis]
MRNILKSSSLIATAVLAGAVNVASATELEVTHWWTSGGEANAVGELAKAFDATGHTWVDGAIAGSGGVARPIIISRIIGGEPMGATQLNHGRQAEELIEAGLLLDLTDVASENNWRNVIYPPSLLDACTVDGRVYCAPVNIHSAQWLWLSHDAYESSGVAVPTNWDEFVAAGPALRANGIVPLAQGQQGWQTGLTFGVLATALVSEDAWYAVNRDKDASVAGGAEYARVWNAFDDARKMAIGSNVGDWNLATNLVITGKAGGQIHGDWAQGEFSVAGSVAGTDYSCLPGLGERAILDTGGDAFYFPVQDDADVQKAQKDLAALLVSREVQVAFNLKKGSLPIRGDIDMSTANDCMQKGLKILGGGNVVPSGDILLSADTNNQVNELMNTFWSDLYMSPADAQAKYAKIIASAD